ncbi:MAG: thiamine phosphate synthase [Actinomycetota bacterium]
MRLPSRLGVYVVTSADLVPGRGHLEVARAALRGGAGAIQLRAPELADGDLLPLARELAATCGNAGALFVVNDRVDVALAAGADGAHLGQGDELERARDRLGPERVLGVSVADPAQAAAAQAAGADYLGVTVWPTGTKPEAIPVGLDGLRAVVAAAGVPVVAIGGIDERTAPPALAAGASGVAVVSAVGAAPDPEAATRRLVDVVKRTRTEAAASEEDVG